MHTCNRKFEFLFIKYHPWFTCILDALGNLNQLLTNGFRSSCEISEVRYKLGNLHSCQSNHELGSEVVNFTPTLLGS